MNAYCYGKRIDEVVDYIEDLIVFHCEGEKYNFVARIKDIVLEKK